MRDDTQNHIHTYTVRSFTQHPTGGNPAGVVLDAKGLTASQMKSISQQLQVSETAFVFPSATADVKTRFFSPKTEVDLCGHATIALFYLLGNTTYKGTTTALMTIMQETRVGLLPVTMYFSQGECIKVMMQQQTPVITPCAIHLKKLCDALHIHKEDIDTSLPFQRVSTGLFTLPIGLQSFSLLQQLQPDFSQIQTLCKQYDIGSFHVYTFDTKEPTSVYHARNFAPCYGINEDPVTGTANGAVCSYLAHHKKISETRLICEQGDIMGSPGRVHVNLQKGVHVGGHAVLVQQQRIPVNP